MKATHGNETQDWFFTHTVTGQETTGLPHCPCSHKHPTRELAASCGTRRRGTKGTHVREIKGGVAVADHRIE